MKNIYFLITFGRTVDPTVWDDIFDVFQELGKGKSVSEAIGSIK